jgi:hypothetical protein
MQLTVQGNEHWYEQNYCWVVAEESGCAARREPGAEPQAYSCECIVTKLQNYDGQERRVDAICALTFTIFASRSAPFAPSPTYKLGVRVHPLRCGEPRTVCAPDPQINTSLPAPLAVSGFHARC